jgi:hypothetical protein
MASLEQAVRHMLTEASSLNSLDNSAITHGYRLFGQTLPAVTFELEQTVDEALAQDVRSVVVRASYIAATTKDAADALSNLRDALAPGTHESIAFSAVVPAATRSRKPSRPTATSSRPRSSTTPARSTTRNKRWQRKPPRGRRSVSQERLSRVWRR